MNGRPVVLATGKLHVEATADGARKPRGGDNERGAVDSRALLAGRHIAFVIAEPSEIEEVILQDIEQAVDVDVEIVKIVACLVNQPMRPRDEEAFRKAAGEKGWEVETLVLNEIAGILRQFRGEASEYVKSQSQAADEDELLHKLYVLVDEFRDRFHDESGHIDLTRRPIDELERLSPGQDVFAVHQPSAGQAMLELLDVSKRAKYVLDSDEPIQDKVEAWRQLLQCYSVNLDLYLRLSLAAIGCTIWIVVGAPAE